jgi:hypothetical protein
VIAPRRLLTAPLDALRGLVDTVESGRTRAARPPPERTMPLLAHAGHWLASMIYVVPVLVVVAFLAVQALRERSAPRAQEEARE